MPGDDACKLRDNWENDLGLKCLGGDFQSPTPNPDSSHGLVLAQGTQVQVLSKSWPSGRDLSPSPGRGASDLVKSQVFCGTVCGLAYNTCLETLSDPSSRRVLPPTAAACGKPITLDEVLTVMSELPLGKSPGPDRLPNKLYKTLASDLADIKRKERLAT